MNFKTEKVKSKLLFLPSICQRYEEIFETIRGTPGTTEELVSLNQYLKHTSEVTLHKMKDEIGEAAKRLYFLMDYATLPGM